MAMDNKNRPQRRNAPETKARILEAAQQLFSEVGYGQAGIRDIAALAGKTSPLLLRYFGSKAGLFEAALIAAMPVETLFGVDKKDVPGLMARKFVVPSALNRAASMIALSAGDPESREIATRIAEQYAIAPTAAWLGPPNAHARAAQLFLMATSFVLYANQIPLVHGENGVEQETLDWFIRTTEAIINQ
jgi:AcrR family transcriptional regulator